MTPWNEIPEDDRLFAVAEHVMGWTWWAWTKSERDSYADPPTPRVVRSLRSPGFPKSKERKQWEEWGKESGKVFRPADGTEPVERIQGTGDAMSSAAFRMADYLRDPSAALEILGKVQKWKAARRKLFVEEFYWRLGTEDVLKSFWAFRDNPSVVAAAAYEAVRLSTDGP